jgi:hypothetical protein
MMEILLLSYFYKSLKAHMHNIKIFVAITLAAFSITANAHPNNPGKEKLPVVKVEVRKTEQGFRLFRNGEPYFIKGAGGTGNMNRLVAYGGNSVRTWGTENGNKVLDSAQKYGLTVLMGLGVTPERHGFNYDDTAAVRKQFDKVRADVII